MSISENTVLRTDEEGNLFILAEVVAGEAWAILSLTAAEIEDGNVPFQTEYLFEDSEEALNAWLGGLDALSEGWKPGDDDELVEAEEVEEATVPSDAIKGIIKKSPRI